MADIYAVFGSLIILSISYPALLIMWKLLFPDFVQRSQARLIEKPRKTFGIGVLTLVAAAVFLGLLFSLPAQFTQVLAWLGVIFLLGISSAAAAGAAEAVGQKLQLFSGDQFNPLGTLIRGALILELAVVFPVIGWLIILPFSLLFTLGAGVTAVLRRSPRQSDDIAVEPAGS